jgi:aryl sulfotransferase
VGTNASVRYANLIEDSARWNGLELRPDDIVISTPPKCGTTWTQMICALLIFRTTTFYRPLSELSPWIDMLTRPRADVIADLDAQHHRRFIKTHTPLDGLPWDERVTYIDVGRDPRDVSVSMAHHMSNMDFDVFFAVLAATADVDGLTAASASPEPPSDGPQEVPSARELFWTWIDNPTPAIEQTSSLLRTLTHHETFWNAKDAPNVVMLHYDDLQADLGGQMRTLAERLGIGVPEDRWPDLVEAATFDEMRDNAGTLAPTIGSRRSSPPISRTGSTTGGARTDSARRTATAARLPRRRDRL